ncbi:MAG: hypothetical protein C5B44_06010 [Acidobacteria bacterium]|nr:MAG: hypothetical protein C5B44_06010 [Acidobacteriota bacterium]
MAGGRVYIATDPVKAAGASRTKAGDYGQLRKSKHLNLLFQSRPLAFLPKSDFAKSETSNEPLEHRCASHRYLQ